MNEFFQKMAERIKSLWKTWSMVQKLILAGVAVAAVIAVVALAGVLSKPAMVPVIAAPITDEAAWSRIMACINHEGVKTLVSSGGVISVESEETARKMRSILIREDLIPRGTDPWAIFGCDPRTITDYERDVNFHRSLTAMVTAHIESLDEVDRADVILMITGRTLFITERKPVTASVILTPRPGSGIRKKKIEGIQKLLKYAVEGLADENIVITDNVGFVLNDFAGMADGRSMMMVKKHIESWYGVDDARITLTIAYGKPMTASVILTTRPDSDIRENRKKIEGIQKILKYAVEWLADENIVITDSNGLGLNDFLRVVRHSSIKTVIL
jgi:flagellar M-ring protein FliF